jgi:predicted PurR-regulated permease PerM
MVDGPQRHSAEPPDSAENRLRRTPAGLAEPAPPRTPVVRAGDVFKWAVAGALGVLCVALAMYGIYAVRDLLVLVVIALFIAVSLDPAVRWLVRHRMRRSFAVAVIFVVVFGLIAAFVASIAQPMAAQASKLFSNLPGYVERLQQESQTYRDLTDRFHLTERISAYTASLPSQMAGSALNFASRFLGAVLSMLTVLVLTIYFMADLPRLRRGLVRLFPQRRRPRVAEVVNVLVDKVGAYMIGNLIISVIAGVSSFTCFVVLKVPYALPLALLVAITDLIPLIGATLGAVLGTLVAFFTAGLVPGIIVLIFFIVYQQVENYLIAPRIMRNTVNISSVAVLLAALLGGNVLGVVGALMAIPLAAAVKVVLTPAVQSLTAGAPPAEPSGPNPPSPEAAPDLDAKAARMPSQP